MENLQVLDFKGEMVRSFMSERKASQSQEQVNGLKEEYGLD